MKKIFTLLLSLVALSASFMAKAALGGDGYYRINNAYTDRYVYIVDNTGSVNVQTTTIEAGAIELWLHLDRTLYDPATVLYIEKHDTKYDIRSQNTGIYQMLGTYVSIYADPRNPGTYWAYGEKSGMVAYLWDNTSSLMYDESYVSNIENKQYPLCRNWYITPIDNNTDNYFGVKPTITAKGSNYAVWYADFPFTFQSDGMNAYYVSKVDAERGLCVYKEAIGTIPAKTPLFIKCDNTDPYYNKLNIGGSANAITDNILTGVFFNCYKYRHDNRTPYNKQTMRSLGVMSDGSLGMITEDYDYVPRNSFYLSVPANAPAAMRLVTEAEYEEITSRPVEAESVTLSATSLSLIPGQTASLTATVSPANTTDPTVTWTTSNTAVATIDANGTVTATGLGTATITAACGNVSAACTVTVNPVEPTAVTLNTNNVQIRLGETYALTATVSPANTTYPTVTWTTSNPDAVTVDANGTVTAVGLGKSTITATCGNVSATCLVVVNPVEAESVTLSTTNLQIFLGETYTITATVLPANTTRPGVTWTTSNPDAVTVDANGTVTAVGLGKSTITATCGNVSATCLVVVNPVEAESVTLSATNLTLTLGETSTITATVLPTNTTRPGVTWTTSDASVATVENGKITAVGLGDATITAICGNVSATCQVTVNPVEAESVTLSATTLSLKIGDTSSLTATVAPSNTTYPTVTWSTSDASVVTVDGQGNIAAVGVGIAVITATCGNVSASCLVNVNPISAVSITLNYTSLTLTIDDEAQLVATLQPADVTDPMITFVSSNPDVVMVDANGKVIAVGAGVAYITAYCGDVLANCTVQVNKIAQTISWEQTFDDIYEGAEIELTATASSGLDIVYEITGDVVLTGNKLVVNTPGEVVITATQPGNERYDAAEAVTKGFDVLAGVNDIIGDRAMVRIVGNNITIHGTTAPVEVYNAAGMLIYRGESRSIAVEPNAVYFIKVAEKIYKTYVK